MRKYIALMLLAFCLLGFSLPVAAAATITQADFVAEDNMYFVEYRAEGLNAFAGQRVTVFVAQDSIDGPVMDFASATVSAGGEISGLLSPGVLNFNAREYVLVIAHAGVEIAQRQIVEAERLPIQITVTVETDAFGDWVISVQVVNARRNAVFRVQTYVTVTIAVNPSKTVTIPINVVVRTDFGGSGGGELELTPNAIREILYEEEIIAYGADFEILEASADEATATEGRPMTARRMGDLDGDGRVTSADATVLALWLVARGTGNENDEIFADFCEIAANITLSGNDPSQDDLVYLARWLVGTAPAPFS